MIDQGSPLATFSAGFLTCHVYLHVRGGSRYYDTVLYRKIRTPSGPIYKRGANLKPTDLVHAIELLTEAKKYLQDYAPCAL